MFISTKGWTELTNEQQPATEPTTPEYGGYTVVARALTVAYPDPHTRGLKAFTRQQVHVWWLRRDRNGFPGKYPMTVRGARKELFRISEVLSWYDGYVPSTGGRQAASGSQTASESQAISD